MKQFSKKPYGLSRKILGFVSAVFLICANAASAFAYGWDIETFQSYMTVEKDGALTVTETIVADYSEEEHHGIFRDIPVQYRDRFGNNLTLRFTVLSIKDETGKDWPYEQTREGRNVHLKIGDPDVYLNKPATFVITYRMDRAVLFFKDHDEVYWNVTGDEWPVVMRSVRAKVTVPEGVADKDIDAACYTGAYGSDESNCNYVISGREVSYDITPAYNGGAALGAYEGLTIVAGFPKGFVTPPTLMQQIIWFVLDNWGYALPFLTFAYMYYLWQTRGRDPYTGKTAIMPIYTPPKNLTPSEIGTLIDETVDLRDISSAIIDLAVRGYLKITELKEKKFLWNSTDYEFQKLKEFHGDGSLKNHEVKILNAVFGGSETKKLSALNNKFYKDLPDIKEAIYGQLVKDGYFPTSPEKVRNGYYAAGGVLLGSVIFGISIMILFMPLSAIIGIAGCGLVVLGFARIMPAKTKKGVDTFYQVKGLEEYISTAEKDRIKFQEDQNMFEKLLPFAMTLGLASRWSSAFEGIYKTPPDWYTSSDPMWHNHFSPSHFTSKLDSISSVMQTSFASSPRSASGGGSGFSGGFSGGGFGGGGGGSW